MKREADATPALEAVVLAAGSSRRFGGGKLTAPFRGGVLLDGALAAAFAAPVRSVTVVTGADPAVEAAARAFAALSGETGRLRVVHAPDHHEGMAASLRAGVASLPLDAAGAFVFLGDMPRVPAAILAPMAELIAQGHAAAAPSFAGRRGNPAVFARALFPDLVALHGDQGARAILDRISPPLVDSPDDGVLFDVDLREQLES
jgi:molybdenum cofactor cytidylyltransferase